MKELPFIVECKSFGCYFEPIAAFNEESVARWYAKDCKEANPMFTYRINSATVRKVAQS